MSCSLFRAFMRFQGTVLAVRVVDVGVDVLFPALVQSVLEHAVLINPRAQQY